MSLKRNLIANFVGQGWTAVMGLAFTPIYIARLGMESYGVIGLFAVMQTWLTLLDLGMTPTLTREMAKFVADGSGVRYVRRLLRSLEVVTLGVSLLILVGVLLASGWLTRDWLKLAALTQGEAQQAVSVMAFVVALRFVESVYRGALLGLHRQVWFNVVNAALATLRWGGAAAVVTFVSPTMAAFFLTHGVLSVVAVLLLRHKVNACLPDADGASRFSLAVLKPVWRFALGMAALSLLTLLLTQTDKLLLSRLLALEDFGYYMLAASVSGLLYLLVIPLTQAAYPRLVGLVALQHSVDLAHLYHATAQAATVLIAPMFLLLALHGAGIVYLWSGDPVLAQRSAPLIGILALGAFLNALMYMPAQAQMAYGWTGLLVKLNSSAAVLLIAALLWAIPRFGAIGAAWVWVALNTMYVVVGVSLMHLHILKGEQLRWYWKDVTKPLAAGALAASAGLALAPDTLSNRGAWLTYLAVSLAACFVFSLLAADALRAMLLARLRLAVDRRHLAHRR